MIDENIALRFPKYLAKFSTKKIKQKLQYDQHKLKIRR
jgi:hypothetical protein